MNKSRGWLLGLALISLSLDVFAANNSSTTDDGDSIEALAGAMLKAEGVNTDGSREPHNPASGFWTCNGIRLHMGVNLATWANLDDGDNWMLAEEPSPVDPKDKDEKVKGTDYLYSSSRNPAVVKYFIVDKTGKNLFIRDDIKFFKTYPCKRTK